MKISPIIQAKIIPLTQKLSELTLLQARSGYGKSTALTMLAPGKNAHYVPSAALIQNEMILNLR